MRAPKFSGASSRSSAASIAPVVHPIACQSPLVQRSAEIAGTGSKDDFAAVEPQLERVQLFQHHNTIGNPRVADMRARCLR
jgi:hypothetical protein